jgi:hypothetical protein
MIFLMSRPAYRSVFYVPQNTEWITRENASDCYRLKTHYFFSNALKR